MINIEFEHWKYVFPEEELIRYGSPHFNQKEAGQALLSSCVDKAKMEDEHSADFDERQILSANEAFPEAAVADPIADIEVWND